MAQELSHGFSPPGALQDEHELAEPMFNVERVQLQFNIAADFVAAQVANNVLILALANGRILRIDLDNPTDIDDVDLPKKSTEVGLIRRMFLDPSASHLIISTTLGENFYLHMQSRQPRPLNKLKGVSVECVAWNPSLPTASTREILIGATDGTVFEIYIEPSPEFYRREDRYASQIYKLKEGPVTGIWVDTIDGQNDVQRIIVASHTRLLHFLGKPGRHGREGSHSLYHEILQKESPTINEVPNATTSAPSLLAISPERDDDTVVEPRDARPFAWLNSTGILHSKLSTSPADESLGARIFSEIRTLPRFMFPATESARGGRKLIQDPVVAMALTQWHVLAFAEGRVIAVNRLDDNIVYDQAVLEPGQTCLGLFSDQKKNTYWLFTSQEIFEIVAVDEDRDVWKVMLQNQEYDAALRYARGAIQKDAVATASGDHLLSKGQYLDAAKVWGKSSKAFEEVCLTLIDKGEEDALRKYLMTKLATYKKTSQMQRTMIACWLIQIFVAKLNALDDAIATKAELIENVTTGKARKESEEVKSDYEDFITKYKGDLDPKTVYEILGSHDREDELLQFANIVNDYSFVLSYWVRRERWTEALEVLQRQSDPENFYKYSSILMSHIPNGLVDVLMRQSDLDPGKLTPALLSYNEENSKTPLHQNQALRYLNFLVSSLDECPPSIHNMLISIHASHPTTSEIGLLSYLESQPTDPPPYDADFALRLCLQHNRVQSAVHIYSSMGQLLQAVELALQNDDIDLAAIIADRPEGNDKLRKKLWLLIAQKKIQKDSSIKLAIEFLKRCELLKIEDLIPFFPDFVVIDDFKDEICTALEEYSRHIDSLKQEMDVSTLTAEQIKSEIKALDLRYAIVEPSEKCFICRLPVLSRQFFVFPCQHAFHSDCLGKKVLEGSGLGKRKHIKDLQNEVSKGMSMGPRREKAVKELDGLIAEACILCGDYAIRKIDSPFVGEIDNANDWAL